jgi:hypothetical protein
MAIIDEGLAKRSKENMSFSDYVEGSATREYNNMVEEARAKIDGAKTRVSAEGAERLDKLFNSYCVNMAAWINKSNSSGSRHVSMMISGPSNYNMKAHERYLSRETTLQKEYNEIRNIDEKITAIIRGDKIIKSGDSDVVEQLTEKVAKLEEEHKLMNETNAYYRKHKTMVGFKTLSDEVAKEYDNQIENSYSWCKQPYPSYTVTNHNAKLNTARERLEQLSKLKERDNKETMINGVRVVENTEAVRIQLFFEGKPERTMIDSLKANGFRWTPSIGAWQRQLNNSGIYAARKVLGL